MMKTRQRIARRVAVAVVTVVTLMAGDDVRAGQSTYPMGEIGGRVALVESKPNVLEIKSVYPDQPGARAKLKPGMLIVGVAGRPFTAGYMMPLKQLGFGIDGARQRNGGLVLNVMDGGSVKDVTIGLSNAPGFSTTFPFNCPRSEFIYDHVCEVMSNEFQAKGKLAGGPVTNSLAVMALLGHKSGNGLKAVEPYVAKTANQFASDSNPEGSVWLLSYHGVMLCEYHLINPDPTVATAIANIAKHLAAHIPSHGRYGHHLRLSDPNEVAYGGQGLNATTSAAVWFFASAARCGLNPSDIQPAFGLALERLRSETNANGGIGYAWKGDHQSSLRSGQTALAWSHLVVSPQLVGPLTSKHYNYRTQVATWPTRHADDLLEAHAVSSMGITASTAGLAAYDRQQYEMLMQGWKWYFALSWQPNPESTSSSSSSAGGDFEVAYVGGPNNTGGDFYLNGHRPLENGFCSIMHATVGFILASSHERLSFYGGMPPIPGLTTSVLAESSQLTKAYMAMRQNKFSTALRIAMPLTKELIDESGAIEVSAEPAVGYQPPADLQSPEGYESGETESQEPVDVADVALSFVDFVDQTLLEPEFDRVTELYEGDDVALAFTELNRFSRYVNGIQKYEIDVDRMMQELRQKKYAKRISVGKRFYALLRATSEKGSVASDIKKWERFAKSCDDEFYGRKVQAKIEELNQANQFDQEWGDKDESGMK